VFIIRKTCTVSFTVSWTYIGSLFAIRLCLTQHQNSRNHFHKLNRCCCTTVSQSLYISEQALRVPGSWGFQISRQSAHEVSKVVRFTHWPSLPSTSGCISGTRGWVDPRNIVRPKGLSQWNIPMTPSRFEAAAFCLVSQCFSQLRHCLPLLLYIGSIYSESVAYGWGGGNRVTGRRSNVWTDYFHVWQGLAVPLIRIQFIYSAFSFLLVSKTGFMFSLNFTFPGSVSRIAVTFFRLC
jgi:hypothetical protein